jgi:hypothetical protein
VNSNVSNAYIYDNVLVVTSEPRFSHPLHCQHTMRLGYPTTNISGFVPENVRLKFEGTHANLCESYLWVDPLRLVGIASVIRCLGGGRDTAIPNPTIIRRFGSYQAFLDGGSD